MREAAALFPRRREVDFPLAERIGPVFMREAADVHRDLFAEFADSYGDNVRTKIERCLTVTDGEYEAAVRARDELAEQAARRWTASTSLLTPTLGSVAPKLPVDDLEIRADTIRLTYPFNALGWPALALPCGPAEDGLPASLQIVGPAGIGRARPRCREAGRVAPSRLAVRLRPVRRANRQRRPFEPAAGLRDA